MDAKWETVTCTCMLRFPWSHSDKAESWMPRAQSPRLQRIARYRATSAYNMMSMPQAFQRLQCHWSQRKGGQ